MLHDNLRPNARERRVLEKLILGDVEAETYFPGVGPKTFEAMIDNGWIERAFDETYETDGYRITEAGLTALDI